MSLINDMLKDLEARRQRETTAHPDLEGVVPPAPPRRLGLGLILGAAALLFASTAGFWWWQGRGESSPVTVATVPEPLSSVPPAAEVVPAPEPIMDLLPDSPAREPAAAEPEPAMTKAVKNPTRPPSKPVPVLVAIPPQIEPPVRSAPSPSAEGFQAGGSRLEKALHEPSPQAKAEAAFRQGAEALRQGRLREAEGQLRQVLIWQAEHLGAREDLAHLLLASGRISEGAALLREGLEVAPQHLPFRTAVARLQVEQGAVPEARQTLLGGPLPEIAADPHFHGLLAAIEQRLGAYGRAADLYALLVAEWPLNGAWWLGLGISLEGAGRRDEAVQAYARAMQMTDLGAEPREFARGRLEQLRR